MTYQLPQRQTAWRTIGNTITTIGQARYRAIVAEVIGPGRSLFDPDAKPGDIDAVAAMMRSAAAESNRDRPRLNLGPLADHRHEAYDLESLESAENAIFEVV